MVSTTATEFWNDPCAKNLLIVALEQGAVGATSNPVIVSNVLKKEFSTWFPRLAAIINQTPALNEVDVARKIALVSMNRSNPASWIIYILLAPCSPSSPLTMTWSARYGKPCFPTPMN